MSSSLAARRFLVTGGTGSFGQTMVRRLLDAGAAEVRVLSRDEAKQDDLRRRLRNERVRYYVGDVLDFDALLKATRGIEYVFHAAALKQVPSCEFFPLEAVRTNVLGSANVVEASERNGVTSLVMLSTDKAVYPVNAMGMSKALMEKVAQAHVRSHAAVTTNVSCVRYGNVMCSRGSVIPLFVEQARAGRPLTVTDPSMTRFLMSLDESVGLVEHAFLRAVPGDLFVRKARACTIGDLATAVCRLFGRPEGVEILGVRHGEKLAETLVSGEELTHAEDQGEFFRIPLDSRDLNYAPYVDEGDLVRIHRGYASDNATRLDVPEIMAVLRRLPDVRRHLGPVPELAAVAG